MRVTLNLQRVRCQGVAYATYVRGQRSVTCVAQRCDQQLTLQLSVRTQFCTTYGMFFSRPSETG